MIKIRLMRLGKKKNPFYRLVAVQSSLKLSGKSNAVLGYWQPAKNLKVIDKKAVAEWVAKGASLTPTVKKLLA